MKQAAAICDVDKI